MQRVADGGVGVMTATEGAIGHGSVRSDLGLIQTMQIDEVMSRLHLQRDAMPVGLDLVGRLGGLAGAEQPDKVGVAGLVQPRHIEVVVENDLTITRHCGGRPAGEAADLMVGMRRGEHEAHQAPHVEHKGLPEG